MASEQISTSANSAEASAFAQASSRLGWGDPQIGSWMARLMVVTALVYSRCLRNEFVFDDHDWAKNQYVGRWSFIWKSFVNDAWWYLDPAHPPQSAYYRPLLDAWAAINFHLFGLNPIGWHAGMIVLYLIVVWQVFRVASMLALDRWTGLLAAAFFALLPIHAESVAWPAAICQPLLAIFELGAFELYLHRADTAASDADRVRLLVLSMILFAGALLSYESAVVFPVLIAMHAFLLSAQIRDAGNRSIAERVRAAIFAMLPYALEVAIYVAVRVMVLGFISRANPHNPHPLNAIEVALTIPGAIWGYLMLLAMPWRAGPVHLIDIAYSVTAPAFYLPAAGLAVVCGAAILMLHNHPHRRLYLFCGGWFLIALAPMLNLSGLFPQSAIEDRYLYFPSFAVCLIAADLTTVYARTVETRARQVQAAVAVVLALFAVITFHAESIWHDDAVLFAHYIDEGPEVEFWRYRYGVALAERGDYANARVQLETAKRLDPSDATDRYDLGLVYDDLGDRKAAVRELSAALERLEHPAADNFIRLALIADAAGDAAARESALKHSALLPGGADAADLARAQLFFHHGDSKDAEAAMQSLIRRAPGFEPAWAAYGSMLVSWQRYDEALTAYRHAEQLAPDAPLLHYVIAFALHHLNRQPEARAECEIAIAGAPAEPKVRALMAAIEAADRKR
ncbi:MAG TPA: tetratricopeptide repeat protein [Candidatus Binataceae bacterium]|nr:tetratricopeptide repeat protein [Candidatus Binataceae bacterium]